VDDLDARRLAPALTAAMAKAGWSELVTAVWCVVKLASCKASPTGFLVTALGRVHADMVLGGRTRYAQLWEADQVGPDPWVAKEAALPKLIEARSKKKRPTQRRAQRPEALLARHAEESVRDLFS
jgi:hypothetical protein